MMQKLFDLLKEPSTYAGFSGLAVVTGLSMDEYQAWANAAAALFAILAVAVSEKKA